MDAGVLVRDGLTQHMGPLEMVECDTQVTPRLAFIGTSYFVSYMFCQSGHHGDLPTCSILLR
jgi:hypothetical protein